MKRKNNLEMVTVEDHKAGGSFETGQSQEDMMEEGQENIAGAQPGDDEKSESELLNEQTY